MTNNDELALKMKAAADSATPGEWRYLKTTPFMDAEISAQNNTRVINLLAGDVTEANSEFIATANPANIKALLAERDADKKRIAEFQRQEHYRTRQAVIDGLAASGECWDDIKEYMEKWDAEADRIKLEVGQ